MFAAENDEVDDDDDDVVLLDPTSARSESTIDIRKSAFKKFVSYLTYQRDRNLTVLTSIDDLTAENATKELVGKFGDWLYKVAKVNKPGTCLTYLTQLKVYIELKFPTNEVSISKKWYTELRAKIFEYYLHASQTTGKSLSDHAKPMCESDLLYCCETLFVNDSREDIHDRHLLIYQFQCLGRITEVCAI